MSSRLLKKPQVRISSETKESIKEIVTPAGIPSCIIGTADKGTAFIPTPLGDVFSLTSSFGSAFKSFGTSGAARWLESGTACTFVRVLGAGDCSKRKIDGSVNNAGFTVGDQLVGSGNTFVKHNPFAIKGGPPGRTYFLGCFMSQSEGSTIFTEAGFDTFGTDSGHPIVRGILMAPSGVLLSLHSNLTQRTGIIRPGYPDTAPRKVTGIFSAGQDAGHNMGEVFSDIDDIENPGKIDENPSRPLFQLFLNGYTSSSFESGRLVNAPNFIQASFDPEDKENYFGNKFNTDPLKIQEAGHYLYTYYDVYSKYATVKKHKDATTLGADYGLGSQAAFLLTSSLGRNESSSDSSEYVGVPNYENFNDRYSHPKSSWIISQTVGRKFYNLFKIHAVSDGEPKNRLKILIHDIEPGKKNVSGDSIYDSETYGTFSLSVYDMRSNIVDPDSSPLTGNTWAGLSLDPSSKDYIAKRIGDVHRYYDFSSKKVVIDGRYEPSNPHRLIRVEMAPDVDDAKIPKGLVPFGFRGMPHLVTSGSKSNLHSLFSPSTGPSNSNPLIAPFGQGSSIFSSLAEPPIPMREKCFIFNPVAANPMDVSLPWGFQTSVKKDPGLPNNVSSTSSDIEYGSFNRFFPSFSSASRSFWAVDEFDDYSHGNSINTDRFNNNLFSLEKIEILTGSIRIQRKNVGIPDSRSWSAAKYCRDGKPSGRKLLLPPIDPELGYRPTRFLKAEDLVHVDTSKFCRFVFPLFGGFDGTNIFDNNKYNLNDQAIRQEIEDVINQGGRKGPTVSAYNKAIEIIENESELDFQFFSIPAIRHRSVTDSAIEMAENRKNLMYLMDIEKYNKDNLLISSSQENIDVVNTVENFKSRMIDSTYVATYFPDLIMRPEIEVEDVRTALSAVAHPSSIIVMESFVKNDDGNRVWDPTVGSTKGHLRRSLGLEFALSDEEQTLLNSARINTILTAAGTDGLAGNYIASQMNLGKTQGDTRIISVRRVMLDFRRRARVLSRDFIFEHANETVAITYGDQLSFLCRLMRDSGHFDDFSVRVVARGKEAKENFKKGIIKASIAILPRGAEKYFTFDASTTSRS